MAGRPLKFKTVEELQEKVDAYFESCFEPEMKRVLNDAAKSKKEDITDADYRWEPILDYNGDPLSLQVKPFTVTGLANYLETTRDLLIDYADKDEYSDTIKRAKGLIHQYAEEYLFTGKNQSSVIFNLKNNWGWVDKTETDHTTKGEKIDGFVVSFK